MAKPSRWKTYADDVADPAKAVHVTVEYQTPGGAPGTWVAWTQADDLEEALEAATEHVRGFKRCGRIYGGSAAPIQRRA